MKWTSPRLWMTLAGINGLWSSVRVRVAIPESQGSRHLASSSGRFTFVMVNRSIAHRASASTADRLGETTRRAHSHSLPPGNRTPQIRRAETVGALLYIRGTKESNEVTKRCDGIPRQAPIILVRLTEKVILSFNNSSTLWVFG